MTAVRIALVGEDKDAAPSLWGWLRDQRELRGRVRHEPGSGGPDHMGSFGEVVVETLVSGASGAVATVLGTCLSSWIEQRRRRAAPAVVVEIRGDQGVPIAISTEDGPEAARLTRMIVHVVQSASSASSASAAPGPPSPSAAATEPTEPEGE